MTTLLVLGGGIFWLMFWGPLGYGCTNSDKRLAPALKSLDIFDYRPLGAIPEKDIQTGCEPDDRYAYAEITYRFSSSKDSLLSFYRNAAIVDGWTFEAPLLGPESQDSKLCFSKPVGDTTALLFLNILQDKDKDQNGRYLIGAAASHSGSASCF
ncbi:hypothetical protein [Streptosporangium sp. NPDC006930]|uniref:hypothetical protein n=1 Tax=unclassified Streptosporangium TaxID=2632669 RepID=UPI003413274F